MEIGELGLSGQIKKSRLKLL
ncbi:hypothetical protein CCACVL1_28070 [Corchorus capsularis]|uniref:Uncharacterized protein n=1 Tax=Corchorus capsularis TaxID=210143 RepID=A0A1R3G7P9_COCAP|nr:hypothetical protein CCACVL1_28070 [Corchorus capsularis]